MGDSTTIAGRTKFLPRQCVYFGTIILLNVFVSASQWLHYTEKAHKVCALRLGAA